MMRHWREREFERGLNPATQRYGLKLWAFFARRPALYRAVDRRSPCRSSACSAGRKGRFALAAARRRLDRATATCRRRKGAPSCSSARPRRERAPGMSARDAILNKVRGALKAHGDDAVAAQAGGRAAEQRAEGHHPGARTTAARGAHRAVLRQGRKTVGHGRAGAARATTCRRRSPPISGNATCRPRSAWAPTAGWPRCRGQDERALEIRQGASDGDDEVGVSHAVAAIAETGTLVLVSGDGQSDHDQFPARAPYRGRRRSRYRRRPRGACWAISASRFGKGKMPRTREPDFRVRRARATSSRSSSSARTARARCISSSSAARRDAAAGVHFLDAKGPDGICASTRSATCTGGSTCSRKMHEAIAEHRANNPIADWRIIHLGDYVDRGTNSSGVSIC